MDKRTDEWMNRQTKIRQNEQTKEKKEAQMQKETKIFLFNFKIESLSIKTAAYNI